MSWLRRPVRCAEGARRPIRTESGDHIVPAAEQLPDPSSSAPPPGSGAGDAPAVFLLRGAQDQAFACGHVRHMRATASQSREPCCISFQMKSYPALAMAQYVTGSVEPKKVPPVTFSPRIIFSSPDASAACARTRRDITSGLNIRTFTPFYR